MLGLWMLSFGLVLKFSVSVLSSIRANNNVQCDTRPKALRIECAEPIPGY